MAVINSGGEDERLARRSINRRAKLNGRRNSKSGWRGKSLTLKERLLVLMKQEIANGESDSYRHRKRPNKGNIVWQSGRFLSAHKLKTAASRNMKVAGRIDKCKLALNMRV